MMLDVCNEYHHDRIDTRSAMYWGVVRKHSINATYLIIISLQNEKP